MTSRLEGKVAVITGAGGGLGGAIARRFAAEGAAVVVHDLRADAVDPVVDAIVAAGGRAIGAVCDVTDSTAVDSMFDTASAELGLVDVLVNCAGTSGYGDAREPDRGLLGLTDASWRRLLSIHLDGTFFASRAMTDRLLFAQRGGSVICISSIAGLAGWGDIHYSTAKGGLLGFVRALARSGGPFGIRANAVCPGVIDAGMTDPLPRELIEPMRAMTPLQRFGSADDIASACIYLASDESGFVTGEIISPNGGLVMS